MGNVGLKVAERGRGRYTLAIRAPPAAVERAFRVGFASLLVRMEHVCPVSWALSPESGDRGETEDLNREV